MIFTSMRLSSVRGQCRELEPMRSSEDPREVASKPCGTRTDFLFLFLAGVTMCVCLSWASSQASGGLWLSSAGSATEPSVSCCLPFTFPICTVCGKLLPWGAPVLGCCSCPEMLLSWGAPALRCSCPAELALTLASSLRSKAKCSLPGAQVGSEEGHRAYPSFPSSPKSHILERKVR